jgi:endonuclease/exonuclease/phosphatase family metal-dependent hydrolase
LKLITLNIWGGRVRAPFLDFVISHEKNTDIFCFQEVYHNAPAQISDENAPVSLNIFSELEALLPDFKGFFKPVVNNIYGICAFVRKTIEVLGEGDIQIYDNPTYSGIGPHHSRNMQWLQIRLEGQVYSILNVHGLWNGKGKKDSPDRILQSQRIREFMDKLSTPKIICGDFNLRPDTESMKIIEDKMHNHIHLHQVSSTRTSLYKKEEKFADYILTSPEVKTHQFAVLDHVVSDHKPLLLEFGH